MSMETACETTAAFDWAAALSAGAQRMRPAPTFLALAGRPDIISFAGGVPDPALFPTEALGAACGRVLVDPVSSAQALQYAPSQGLPALREWISRDLAARGMAWPAEQIVVTSGAQQGLDLLAKLLLNPGDRVAVTAPTFFAALDTFNAYQPQYEAIAFGGAGLAMDQAEAALSRHPKFLYLNPDFQNPTGLCLTLREREHVLDLCAAYRVPVLEDAAYEALRFRGAALPSLAALAQSRGLGEWVIHVSTFSKTLAPGLRVGFMAGPAALSGKLCALKLSADVHTSVLNQMAVLQVAQSELPAQLARVREAYALRCQLMLGALERYMPPGVVWTQPEGGLFIWLTLPPEVDTLALLPRAIEDAGVAYVPGSLSFANGAGRHCCRLSFATVAPARIETGVRLLARLFASVLTGTTREAS